MIKKKKRKKRKKEKKKKRKSPLFPSTLRALYTSSHGNHNSTSFSARSPLTPLSPPPVRLRVLDPLSSRWTTCLPFPPRVPPRVPPLRSPLPLNSLGPTSSFETLFARPAKGLTCLLSSSQSSTTDSWLNSQTERQSSSPSPAPLSTLSRP